MTGEPHGRREGAPSGNPAQNGGRAANRGWVAQPYLVEERAGLFAGVLILVVVGWVRAGREGDSAEDFGEGRGAQRNELLVGCLGGRGVGQAIADGYETVGVCALIA